MKAPATAMRLQGQMKSSVVADLHRLASVVAHAGSDGAHQDQAKKKYEEKLFHDNPIFWLKTLRQVEEWICKNLSN